MICCEVSKTFLKLHLFVTNSCMSFKACKQGKRQMVQIQSCIKYDDVYSDNISQSYFLYRLLNPSFPRYFVVLVIIYGAIPFLSLLVSHWNFLRVCCFGFFSNFVMPGNWNATLQQVLLSQYISSNKHKLFQNNIWKEVKGPAACFPWKDENWLIEAKHLSEQLNISICVWPHTRFLVWLR